MVIPRSTVRAPQVSFPLFCSFSDLQYFHPSSYLTGPVSSLSSLFQSIFPLPIIKKTNQNPQRPSPYPARLWVKLMKVLAFSNSRYKGCYLLFFYDHAWVVCSYFRDEKLSFCIVFLDHCFLSYNTSFILILGVLHHVQIKLFIKTDTWLYTYRCIGDRLTAWLACSSRLRGLEEEGRQGSDEGEQLLSPGENLWESPDQSSCRTAGPRQGGLDVQIWWKSVDQKGDGTKCVWTVFPSGTCHWLRTLIPDWVLTSLKVYVPWK